MSSAEHTQNQLSYLPQLDVLRGAACLMVLLAHANRVAIFQWIPDIVGVIGVGVFFALSGFLITRILLMSRSENRSLVRFYDRRAARIFPVFYITLAVLAFACPSADLYWAADFTFNWRFLASSRDYFRPDAETSSLVAHFWSLCVEEHFYWFWPAAIVGLPLYLSRLLPFLVLAATPFACWCAAEQLATIGFSPQEINGLLSRITVTQMSALAIGAIAAWNETALARTDFKVPNSVWAGGLLVAIALGLEQLCREKILSEVAFSTLAIHLLCGGLFLFGFPFQILSRLLPLRLLGKISYGAYVFHLPLYYACGVTGDTPQMMDFATAFACTIGFAILSFRCLELPIITCARTLSPQNFLYGSGVAASFCILGIAVAGLSHDLSALAAQEPGGESLTADLENPSIHVAPQEIQQIVVGSSHAMYGVMPVELKAATYNLANQDQDLWYDCNIAQKMAHRLPNLRRVLFCYSSFSPWHIVADREDWKSRLSIYYFCWQIRSQNDEDSTAVYSNFAIATDLSLHDRLLSKQRLFRNGTDQGWSGLIRSGELDLDAGSRIASRHGLRFQANPDYSRNLQVFLQTIQSLQRRGIECLVFSTPVHACYRNGLNAEQSQKAAEFIRIVCERSDVSYHDFASDDRFRDNDFYDADHLSAAGARKFTRILNQAIED
ncbi:O-acetyltransferase OatA [Lignipirellula cremea]|uniref:O-acetyltransferase OatA n=2 Tax=Lignipirellula cremea TaxID=2528010 RepID=A0A518DNH2_9BACT|nr:O-acetyltransferase OatA [Lignipirellula cremea]